MALRSLTHSPTEVCQPKAAASTQPLQGWAYDAPSGRDLRLDVLRGCFVVAMVVDHLGGASWLHLVTGGNRFFVSAAEGFVLVSGLVMGLVYRKLIARDGLAAATRRAVRRAGVLYLLSVGLSAAFFLMSSVTGASWAEPLADLPSAMLATALLQRSNYLSDVLMLYALLVLAAPLAFALLQRGRSLLLLAGSLTIWAAHQVGATYPIDTILGGGDYFPPLAWQVIFVAGLVIGHHWRQVGGVMAQAAWRWGLAVLAVVAVGLVWLATWGPSGPLAEQIAAVFAKEGLRGGRLIAAMVFMPLLFAIIHYSWRPLYASLGWLLEPLGQGALLAYALHLFLAIMANVWWPYVPGYNLDDPLSNTAAHVLVIVGLWLLIKGLADGGALRRTWQESRARVGGWLVQRSAAQRRWLSGAAAGACAVSLVIASSPWLVGAPTLTTPAVPAAPVTIGASPANNTANSKVAPVRAPAVPTYIARRAERAATVAARQGASLLPAATATPLVPKSQSASEQHRSFYSPTLQRTMPYWVLLPPGYERETARYPVLYLLHGMGGDRGEWVEYGVFATAKRLFGSGALPPFIIVLPEGEQSYWIDHVDGPRWGHYVATDLVDHIDTTFRTRPEAAARAIGGLSMGAASAFVLATTVPDRFQVVGMHSPSIRSEETALPFFGQADAFAQRDPIALIKADKVPAGLRIALDIGAADGWLGAATAVHEALDEHEIDHAWQVSSGSHDGAYWSQQLEAYLRFYGATLHAPRAGR